MMQVEGERRSKQVCICTGGSAPTPDNPERHWRDCPRHPATDSCEGEGGSLSPEAITQLLRDGKTVTVSS